jgi:hypothetical protein
LLFAGSFVYRSRCVFAHEKIMAWRIDKSVIKGEIDNRECGRVRGRVWLLGRDEPVTLVLRGNCHADLAGCLLHFENPSPQPGDHVDLYAAQNGTVGDMTASRKVRVFDVPVEEALRMAKAGERPPEHMGNCLYIEWFSETNGRVVIESVDFTITVSEPAWRLSREDQQQQIESNREAFCGWLDQIAQALPQDDEDDEEYEPPDEFESEKFLKESDERLDQYTELLEKYKDHPDCDKLVAREMGWTWLEEALEADERGALPEPEPMDLPELVPNPLTEGIDWVRDEDGRVRHPLAIRAFESSMAMWHHCKDKGLLGEDGDADLREMLFEFQTTGAKLAGALNGLAYHNSPDYAGFIVARLKRALSYLNKSVAATAAVARKKLVEPDRLEAFRKELFEVREEILRLMERFRGSGK